ncbi:penicillin-binding protein activator [Sphingomonas sp.]|uniref:penicillin-binding protein activator n=1 Tax=Sphingomonas sp. TaxID=28214 RepID=UPI00286CEA4F|nr:penicillin-binding protein activator [Sphingomonas sp.]
MALSPKTRQARRAILAIIGSGVLLLAGCQTNAPMRPAGPNPVGPNDGPDAPRHRVAIIIPLSGQDAGVGTSIANAASLALMDSGDRTIRLLTYDSASGAAAAAERAIGEGAELILGPLLAEDVRAVTPVARRSNVPVVAFSNDASVAGGGIYIMGATPGQAIDRVIRYSRSKGATRFGALVPTGLYGQRAAQAMLGSVRSSGGSITGLQTFNRSVAAVRSAAQILSNKGEMDAVLIADSGKMAAIAGSALRPGARLMGTELWAGDRTLGQTARLRGALFAAAPDARFTQLVGRYKARYGKTPYRLGSLGYDAMLLTVRSARSWPVGRPFPMRSLADRDGFAGVDGIFRFGRDGVAERSLEVRQVTATGAITVSPAATSFAK